MVIPRVAIIVLNWNRPGDTLECLQSLEKLLYGNFEIVVVDNGSTDKSVELISAQFPTITLLQTGQNLGYAGGNNHGLNYAMEQKVDYVFVLNNDTTVEPDCLEHMVQAGESDTSIGAVGCFVYTYDPPRTFLYAGLRASCKLDRPTMGSYVYNEVYDQLNAGTVIQIDAAHGCAFLIKRTALERVKGFDPKFFAVHEEVDLSMRIREAGYQIVSVSHARIFHKVGATFGASSPSRTYYDVRNKVHYFSNRATAQKRRLLPSFWIFYIVAGLGRTVKQLTRGNRAQADAVFQGMIDGILRREGPRPAKNS